MVTWQFQSRHPVNRLIAASIGLLALLALVTLGLFAAAVLVAGGIAVWIAKRIRSAWRSDPPPHRAPPGVIEGEFTVVSTRRARNETEAHGESP